MDRFQGRGAGTGYGTSGRCLASGCRLQVGLVAVGIALAGLELLVLGDLRRGALDLDRGELVLLDPAMRWVI